VLLTQPHRNSATITALDLFTFSPFDNNIYISEKLETAIKTAGITGFKILETDKFE
jgi:hypothetical protein